MNRPPIITKRMNAEHIRTRRKRMNMLEPEQTDTTSLRKVRDGVMYQINYRLRDGEWHQFGRAIELGPAAQLDAPAPKTKHDPKRAEIEAALEQFDREHEENRQ